MATGRAANKHLNKLQVIQSKALRIVDNLPSRASCSETIQNYKLLTIKNQYLYTNCVWEARCVMDFVAETVKNIVVKCHNFDRNQQLMLDNMDCEKAKKISPKTSIVKAWNDLPMDIREISGMARGKNSEHESIADRIKHAKKILKEHFLEREKEAN